MPTWRRSAQGDGSSRGAGREPAQHEQDASHPQAAAPATSRPRSRTARFSSCPSGRHLPAGVVTMERDASPPPPALAADRWRAVSRLAIGPHHVWRTRAAATARRTELANERRRAAHVN